MKQAVALAAAILMAVMPAVASAQTAVGNATKVVRDVKGTLNSNSRVLQVSNDVFASEKIETAPDSATELRFADGTNLSVGPGSDVTLDSFVYDSGANTGKVAINVAKGAMRFVTGKMSSASYAIRTPHATIGIRGTILSVVVTALLTSVLVEQGIVTVAGAAGVAQTVGAGQASSVAPGGAASPPSAPPPDAVASVNNMDATLARAPGVAATGAESTPFGLTGLPLIAAGAAVIGVGVLILNNSDNDDGPSGAVGTTGTSP